MNTNYFIIHGSYGNPYKNWIPWLYKQITKRGNKCIVPHFPSPKGQDFTTWANILMQYKNADYINENTVIITHSLGGIFIVKFLKENNIKIKKLITIAGFNHIKYKEENLYNSFYTSEEKVDIANETICFYSTNDPYVPIEKAQGFADMINGNKIECNNAGHFSKNDGYEDFEGLLKYI